MRSRTKFFGSLLLLAGCAVNPATGEREFSLVSESQEIQMGREADPQVAAQFAGTPANRHWDLLTAVHSAWVGGDAWTVDRTELDPGTVAIELVADDSVAVGDARVTARVGGAAVTEAVAAAFAHPTVGPSLALEKWARHDARDPGDWLAAVRAWLESDDVADRTLLSAAGVRGSGR